MPDVTAQADAATVQITRILTMLDGQIAADEAKIKELQAQLDAAKTKDPSGPPSRANGTEGHPVP